tara:strand:- start:518 stop:1552 length:1035 start_codon:yes stop_codon:yes gene_type:complete
MNQEISPVLITGAAGFIGSALAIKLIKEKISVIGLDNINSYYDINLKNKRLENISQYSNNEKKLWKFYKVSLEDEKEIEKIFIKDKPKVVVNLAAQAGVRYSLENPKSYIQSNLVGFANILEACRKHKVENLIYASSSSVYGGNKQLPYSEVNSVNHPVSLYAATKKSNELMAHCYSYLYGIPITGLRFFTVYGPWGRPDMAPIIFAKAIINQEPINVFNFGKMKRDFTYIDDIVEGIYRCCYKPATADKNFDYLNPNQSTSFAPHRVFNIGNNKSIELLKFIEILENELNSKAIKIMKPLQPGDVIATEADTQILQNWIQYSPKTSIEVGIKKFAQWFLDFYF